MVRHHEHVYIGGHRDATAVVGDDVATLIFPVRALGYLVFLGKAFVEDVALRSERSITLYPSVVPDLVDWIGISRVAHRLREIYVLV